MREGGQGGCLLLIVARGLLPCHQQQQRPMRGWMRFGRLPACLSCGKEGWVGAQGRAVQAECHLPLSTFPCDSCTQSMRSTSSFTSKS